MDGRQNIVRNLSFSSYDFVEGICRKVFKIVSVIGKFLHLGESSRIRGLFICQKTIFPHGSILKNYFHISAGNTTVTYM